MKSSPFCGAFAAHVNAAIGNTTRNDEHLGDAIVALQRNDLAGNAIARRNQVQRYETLADAMYREFRSGEAEVNRLRDLAKTATDDQQKADLKAAADALGGALYRQHLIQRDLDGFVNFLHAADMRSDTDTEQLQNMGLWSSPKHDDSPISPEHTRASYWLPRDMGRMDANRSTMPGDETPADDAVMAQAASHDFQARLPDILKDELNAGGHIADTSERC